MNVSVRNVGCTLIQGDFDCQPIEQIAFLQVEVERLAKEQNVVTVTIYAIEHKTNHNIATWHNPVLSEASSTGALFVKDRARSALLRPLDSDSAACLKTVLASMHNYSDDGSNHFDQKTDQGSADLYFHYYGMLQHQQNMLQDYIRTGTYHAAIVENAVDFCGKAVMDVGCGSGVLALFAAAAGARVVYAVEASGAAKFAAQLASANSPIGNRIKVIHGKVEEVEIPEKVDVLVSEPMGTLLVNERMLESYLYARDRYLKPGGKMFPRLGRIHLAAFSDEMLHAEVASKSSFWEQPNFYGIDLTCLAEPAAKSYFTQVVVDQIPPNVLVSNCTSKTFDFLTISETELQDIRIPLSLQVGVPCTVHGIAAWFDVLFDGSTVQRWLSTAPGLPVTHWFQLRCLLERGLVLERPGETVCGELFLSAHSRQSYDVGLTLKGPALRPGDPEQSSAGTFDLKDPYYRQLTPWGGCSGLGDPATPPPI